MLKIYLDLNFDVIKKADNSRYANGDNIKLVNRRPIALFSNFKLTTNSGSYLEEISQAHIVCLKQKILTSSIGLGDLYIGLIKNGEGGKTSWLKTKT